MIIRKKEFIIIDKSIISEEISLEALGLYLIIEKYSIEDENELNNYNLISRDSIESNLSELIAMNIINIK